MRRLELRPEVRASPPCTSSSSRPQHPQQLSCRQRPSRWQQQQHRTLPQPSASPHSGTPFLPRSRQLCAAGPEPGALASEDDAEEGFGTSDVAPTDSTDLTDEDLAAFSGATSLRQVTGSTPMGRADNGEGGDYDEDLMGGGLAEPSGRRADRRGAAAAARGGGGDAETSGAPVDDGEGGGDAQWSSAEEADTSAPVASQGAAGEEGAQGGADAGPYYPPKRYAPAVAALDTTAVDYDVYFESLRQAQRGPSNVTAEFVYEDQTVAEAKAAAEAAKKQARRDKSYLVPERQSFREYEMSGMTLLLAEDGYGRVSMADSYIYDSAADLYERPTFRGDVPTEHLRLQVIPWVERRNADSVVQKAASEKMRKLIFIQPLTVDPWELDFSTVWVFDDTTRVLSKEPVRSARPESEMWEPTLRIRPGGVTLEDGLRMPDPTLISDGQVFEDETAEMRPAPPTDEEREAKMERDEEEKEARMLELEEEEKQSLELELDIPASDMM